MIRGVDMNGTHVRVWLDSGSLDFELPRGRRPKHWTVLRLAVPLVTPKRRKRAR